MKNKMKLLICVATVTISAQTQAVEISGTVTATSDYLYDGLSQTGNDAALQAGLTIANDTGFYFSTWASQVDFGAICGDNLNQKCQSNIETDWLVGYGGGDENFSYDIGYAHYKYISSGDGFDYSEIYGSIYFFDTKLALYHSRDFGGTEVSNSRIKITHTVNLNDTWSVPIEFGHDAFEEAFDFGGAIDKSFNYYRAAVGYTIDNWYAEASYTKTSLTALEGSNKDALSIDGNIVFSVTYSFGNAE